MSRESAAGQVLLDGLSDWVDIGMVRQYVRDAHPTVDAPELRAETLRLIDWLLHDGLVVAGDVAGGFDPWPGGAEDSSRRIRASWQDPHDRLLPGDICWFSTTEAGDDLARRLDAT